MLVIVFVGYFVKGRYRMQNFAAACSRSIIIPIIIITLLISISLFINSKLYLIAAVICGYIIALYYFLMLAARIKRSMISPSANAGRIAKTGLTIRIIVLLLVLLIALKLTKEIFIAFIAGFFVMHIIMLVNLIIFAYKEKIH